MREHRDAPFRGLSGGFDVQKNSIDADDKKDELKWNFRVLGMTCATCSRIVERALKKTEGVSFASVNLATDSAFVITSPDVTMEALAEAVKNAGYEIARDVPEDFDEMRYKEARRNLAEVLAIGLPLSFLMYLHMFFGFHWAWYGPLEIVLGAAALFRCGRRTLRGAWIALSHKHTNMDTLIALSSTASWLTAILNFTGAAIPSFGAVGVMIMMLHLLGRYIESRLRDKAAKQVKTLLTLQPREARIITDGGLVTVPVDAVKADALIRVNAGERIPLDGVVEEGSSGVDESLLTGESLPVTKLPGSEVTGGSLNLDGPLVIRATKVGADTFLSQMLELVRDAQGAKVPLQALADRITLKFVPTVIALACLSAAAWYVFFPRLTLALEPLSAAMPWPSGASTPVAAAAYAFIATLVIACPCALGLATPLALVASAGEASRSGLLIRNAEAVQTLRDADFALLDKTGTITRGEPKVVEWSAPEEALPYIYALEADSGHPLAAAVTEAVGARPYDYPDEMKETAGEGVAGRWGGDEWFVGRALERSRWKDAPPASTLVEVRKNGEPAGFFAIADRIRDDSRAAVEELKKMGVTPMMATGDGGEAARQIAKEAGIDEFRSDVRPEGKLAIVREAQSRGRRVIVCGDGINDAAALKAAEVGVAMGTGMDLAVDSADIVIMKGGLARVVAAIKISNKTSRVIKENLFAAFVYNIIAIPLAMAGLLHPIAAECAMAASSITVILNSLRIIGSAKE